ncbi:methylated-DNA--[protein]-cysteine S-methyltransferase [Marinactinospora thermotolerans]|uniref:methylated-DNA--[protein]-cysteine S-methyltransferase n=1 Tax=Marinactinospora thermotolerans TaxID=531310 RepID=UPI003D8AC63F
MTKTWSEERPGDPDLGGDLDALIRATSSCPPPPPAPPRRSALPREALDVVTGTVETPIGVLSLALTRRGLVSCSFDAEETVLPRLARAVSPRIGAHEAGLDPVRRELDAYFNGRLTSFTIPLDLRLTSDFGRLVLRSLLDVEHGTTTTHGRLAARIGRGRAIRAVASSLATDPVCVLLPCHRVVPEDYPEDTGPYAGAPRPNASCWGWRRSPRPAPIRGRGGAGHR